MEFLELGPSLERSASRVSDAVQRRLDLARALVADRPVLLLDHPDDLLDDEAQGRLFALLRLLVGEGRTVLFTSRRAPANAPWSDESIELQGGRVVRAGSVVAFHRAGSAA